MAANDLYIGQMITLANKDDRPHHPTGPTGRITSYDADRDEWRVTIYHAEGTAQAGMPLTHRRLRTDEITELLPPKPAPRRRSRATGSTVRTVESDWPPVDPDKYSHDEDWGADDRPRDDGTGYPVYRVED